MVAGERLNLWMQLAGAVLFLLSGGWLMALLAVGVGFAYLPFPKAASLVVIFAAALAKALLWLSIIGICASSRA